MSPWAVDGCCSLSRFSGQERLNSLPRRSLQGRSGSWGEWQGRMGSSALAWEGWQEPGRKLKMLKIFLIR